MAEQPDLTERTEQYVELTRFLAAALVGDDVEVKAATRNGQPSIQIAVPEELRGRVIGKGGRVIGAIRTLLESASFADGDVPSLDIVD